MEGETWEKVTLKGCLMKNIGRSRSLSSSQKILLPRKEAIITRCPSHFVEKLRPYQSLICLVPCGNSDGRYHDPTRIFSSKENVDKSHKWDYDKDMQVSVAITDIYLSESLPLDSIVVVGSTRSSGVIHGMMYGRLLLRMMLRESWLASPFGEEFRNATKQLWRWMKRKIMKSCCSSVLPSNHGVSKCFCSSNLYHHHLLHCHQLQWREKTAVVFPYAFGMTAGISIWTLYKIALQNCTVGSIFQR
eukprot:jgi/Bigna1/86685/estExt_fgenesh1_pg.C_120259